MYLSKSLLRIFIPFLILFVLQTFAFAHDYGEERIGKSIENASLKFVVIAVSITAFFVFISVIKKDKSERLKWILMIGIAVPVLVATLYAAGVTIYLNIISETKGPVHWHADFEIWDCGGKINLIDPKGLLNRVGTPVFHEHDDDRIHVEGAVYKKDFVDLHSFFETVGGVLINGYLAVPTDQGMVEMRNGDLCNNQPAELQVFLFKITNPNPYARSGFFYSQEKLEDFENYILSPYINIPPGDCIIIEFGPEKPFTDKICESYEVAIKRGDLEANGS